MYYFRKEQSVIILAKKKKCDPRPLKRSQGWHSGWKPSAQRGAKGLHWERPTREGGRGERSWARERRQKLPSLRTLEAPGDLGERLREDVSSSLQFCDCPSSEDVWYKHCTLVATQRHQSKDNLYLSSLIQKDVMLGSCAITSRAEEISMHELTPTLTLFKGIKKRKSPSWSRQDT